MRSTAQFLEPFASFAPSDFVFKIAQSQNELDGFWELRHRVFCLEQELFHGTDRDEYDESMIPMDSSCSKKRPSA